MALVLLAVGVLVLAGILAGLCHRAPLAASIVGPAGVVAAAALALPAAFRTLAEGGSEAVTLPWSMPLGTLAFRLDALAAFFLVPILGLSALAALYGAEYLWHHREGRSLGLAWLWYDLLVAAMVAVVVAADGLAFLVAWEAMALASFFLVVFEHDRESSRKAAWTYLVATHLGTAFVVALFLVLGGPSGSLAFDAMGSGLSPAAAGLCFVLALVGFGTKAGLMPLHVWLPEAHPAAPSHVSAVMSGAMIKTGVYAFLRVTTLLGAPPLWWGILLVVVAGSSAVLGVLFALAQGDLKRLLAYSSVENVAIVLLGCGVGFLGQAAGRPDVAALGFAGGLLHVLNHAVMKGLLFLGAGAVLTATGTRDLERLGGLGRSMPFTSLTFLVGAAAIAGLPPFNGFVGEFLVYLGAFRGVAEPSVAVAAPLALAIAALALAGGLAAATFAKAFGVIFLGAPRSDDGRRAEDPGALMRAPMALLVLLCVGLGLTGPRLAAGLAPTLACLGVTDAAPALADGARWLSSVTSCALALLGLCLVLGSLRRALLSGRTVAAGPTWDCGYVAPAATMQYTASSFAAPLLASFRGILGTWTELKVPEGYFPPGASVSTVTADRCREALFAPVFRAVRDVLTRGRVLQEGRIQVYVLYMVATLVALLIWKLG